MRDESLRARLRTSVSCPALPPLRDFGMAREQDQFLDVVDRDAAERRWWSALRPEVLAAEAIGLRSALGRVLADDVVAGVDVPPFDRSNVDGFAVRAEDTVGASE